MQTPIPNRASAGRELAEQLQHLQNREDVIVLALPRGGVPIGFEVAKHLNVPLDLLLVRKLGVPSYPELAMGAIASGDVRILNPQVLHSYAVKDADIKKVENQERQELLRREQAYRDVRPYPELTGKAVVLVDDGLATGATMFAAIDAIKSLSPSEIIVAVPVAPPTTVMELEQKVDQVVCPVQPENFSSLGEWYEDFSQVSDDEVTFLLEQAWHNEHAAQTPF